MKSVLDPSFRYVPSHASDVRKTFERVRRAYVAKLRSDATPGTPCGYLENIVTGWQCEFARGRELLESIASELEASAERSPVNPRAGMP